MKKILMAICVALAPLSLHAYKTIILQMHQETATNLNSIVFFDEKGTLYNFYLMIGGDITDPMISDPKYDDMEGEIINPLILTQLDKDIELMFMAIDPTGWLDYRATQLYEDQLGRKYAVRESWYNDGSMDLILYDEGE